MGNPLISVIVPVYNLENYVKKNLDNIFSQTYKNIEVIAVDDGSKDGSAKILDLYAKKEPRLKVIHKENDGVTKARLTGVEASSGDYIGFVDGDDLLDADMYERLLQNAVNNDVDISHCGYRMIMPSGVSYDYYNTGKCILQDNIAGIKDLIEGKIMDPGLCNKLFKRELFDSIFNGTSLMDFSIKNNEDLLMNYCLFKNARKSYFEDFCPYQYIIRYGSADHGEINKNKLEDPIKASEIILNDLKNNKQLYLYAARLYIEKIIPVSTNRSQSIKKYKEVRNDARKKLKGFVKEYLSVESGSSLKIKMLFAAYLPGVYGLIHGIYSKMK